MVSNCSSIKQLKYDISHHINQIPFGYITAVREEKWRNHKNIVQTIYRVFLHTDDSADYSNVGWMLSYNIDECMICNKEFNLTVRFKHHCRACGQVICHSCCSEKRTISQLASCGPVRVCSQCYWGQNYLEAVENIEYGTESKDFADLLHASPSKRKSLSLLNSYEFIRSNSEYSYSMDTMVSHAIALHCYFQDNLKNMRQSVFTNILTSSSPPPSSPVNVSCISQKEFDNSRIVVFDIVLNEPVVNEFIQSLVNVDESLSIGSSFSPKSIELLHDVMDFLSRSYYDGIDAFTSPTLILHSHTKALCINYTHDEPTEGREGASTLQFNWSKEEGFDMKKAIAILNQERSTLKPFDSKLLSSFTAFRRPMHKGEVPAMKPENDFRPTTSSHGGSNYGELLDNEPFKMLTSTKFMLFNNPSEEKQLNRLQLPVLSSGFVIKTKEIDAFMVTSRSTSNGMQSASGTDDEIKLNQTNQITSPMTSTSDSQRKPRKSSFWMRKSNESIDSTVKSKPKYTLGELRNASKSSSNRTLGPSGKVFINIFHHPEAPYDAASHQNLMKLPDAVDCIQDHEIMFLDTILVTFDKTQQPSKLVNVVVNSHYFRFLDEKCFEMKDYYRKLLKSTISQETSIKKIVERINCVHHLQVDVYTARIQKVSTVHKDSIPTMMRKVLEFKSYEFQKFPFALDAKSLEERGLTRNDQSFNIDSTRSKEMKSSEGKGSSRKDQRFDMESPRSKEEMKSFGDSEKVGKVNQKLSIRSSSKSRSRLGPGLDGDVEEDSIHPQHSMHGEDESMKFDLDKGCLEDESEVSDITFEHDGVEKKRPPVTFQKSMSNVLHSISKTSSGLLPGTPIKEAKDGCGGKNLSPASMLIDGHDSNILTTQEERQLKQDAITKPEILMGWQVTITDMELSKRYSDVYIITSYRKNWYRKTEFRLSRVASRDIWLRLKRSDKKSGVRFALHRKVMNS